MVKTRSNLIQDIRATHFEAEDSVCLQRARLLTESYAAHEHEPPPIKHAKAFAHVLANMDLDLESNPVFAGNTSSAPRAIMVLPEHGFSIGPQIELENPGLGEVYRQGIPDDLRGWWDSRRQLPGGTAGIGHLAVDYEFVVHHGLRALINRLEEIGIVGTSQESLYRKAMHISASAVIKWAGRYADEAARLSAHSEDSQTEELYNRMATACRQVPAHPARTLFEGLQAIALVHLAIALEGHGLSVSIGSPDRVLERFAPQKNDLSETAELIAAFYFKIASNSIAGRGSKTQAITVGGCDVVGRDRCNTITLAFLEACELARVGDPHLFLRWHPDIDPTVEKRAAELLANGLSMPLLVSDEPTIQGLVNTGVDRADAADYCVIGCNELGIPGLFADSANAMNGTTQYLPAFLDAIEPRNGRPIPESMEAILDRMSVYLSGTYRKGKEHGRKRKADIATGLPTPFTSSLMNGCAETGRDLMGGTKYSCAGIYERGLTNVVNSLLTIEDLCFCRKLLSVESLAKSLAKNAMSAELEAMIASSPKWGGDTHQNSAVTMARRVLDAREKALASVYASDEPYTVCHVVRSLHHLDGANLGATPDGRKAGEPLADSVGVAPSTPSGGLSDALSCVASIDAPAYYAGGYNFNITVDPVSASADTIKGIIRGFFASGGQELQINCVSAETLQSAMARPDEYSDLVVRVAGFSARFIDLPEKEQLEILARVSA